ncbi:MAG: ABC transporter permease [Clostridiales Family XIII bacterium]|jgi:peptide/nickel transport system permease protein|nr:ABC transporter permease [Clostridiales Family XIII bacterium]
MKYAVKKLVQSAVILFFVSIVIFLAVRASGDPLQSLLDPRASDAQRAALSAKLGLDKPLIVQYGIFVFDALRGDLGNSHSSGRPVLEIIGEKLPGTVVLSIMALLIAILFTLLLGTLAAVKKNRAADRIVAVLSALGQSFPVFFVGIIAVQLLGVKLRIFPISGADTPLHYVLPGVLLGLCVSSSMALVLRNNLLAELESDHVKFARLRGLNERSVLFRHALRNSFSTVLSLSAFIFANLITGSIVIESVFAWPGIGELSYQAIMKRDFPLVQGIVLIFAILIVSLSLLTDILHAALDPRIRLGKEEMQ